MPTPRLRALLFAALLAAATAAGACNADDDAQTSDPTGNADTETNTGGDQDDGRGDAETDPTVGEGGND